MLKTFKPFNNTFLINRPLSSSLGLFSKPSAFISQPKYKFSYDPRFNRSSYPQQNQNPSQSKQTTSGGSQKSKFRFLFFAIAALSGLGLSYYNNILPAQKEREQEKEKSKKRESKPQIQEQNKIGGSWRLVDLKGEMFTEKDLEGSYYLLYFGFCFCPDVCPETLTKIGKALEILKNESGFPIKKLKTVFVSVDPDRDTPERMEKFLKMFDDKIIGLRGLSNDDPNLQEMLKKFRILVMKVGNNGIKGSEEGSNKDDKSYNLDHTVITYLMDKKNNCIKVLSPTMDSQDMADHIKKAVQENK